MVKRNIIIARAGGSAGRDSVNYKVSLPADMVRGLGVTREDRGVMLSFDGGEIRIRKDDGGARKDGTKQHGYVV